MQLRSGHRGTCKCKAAQGIASLDAQCSTRIEQVAEGSLELNQGTIYPALLRLEQKGWIGSDWGTSENNRRARFYSITRSGRRQLQTEEASWHKTVATVARLLEGAK